MTTGTGTYMGLAVPLNGESEITQTTAATDLLTLTGVASATGNLLTIQTSSKAPATDGLRYLAYGRLRLIRTDAAEQHTFINTLDVKMDLNYAAGAAQIFAATLILDTVGGSSSGGREAVLQLQYYGGTHVTNGMAYSFIDFYDAATTDVGSLFTIRGSTNLFVTATNTTPDHGLIIYVDNVKYFIMLCDASAS